MVALLDAKAVLRIVFDNKNKNGLKPGKSLSMFCCCTHLLQNDIGISGKCNLQWCWVTWADI